VSVNDPLNGTSSQTYDEGGNLKTIADLNLNTATFNYDAAGRLIKETTAIGNVKTYGYNSINLLTCTKTSKAIRVI
jgi:YD repeat-containing protein